jgi:predicted DNA-binding ribbon-helix-helix protein
MCRQHHQPAIRRALAGTRAVESSLLKRSIVVAGRHTSVSLEDEFWKDLREIAARRGVTLSDLVTEVDADRQVGNLSSAIRVFVLHCCHDRISEYEKRDRTRELLAKALGSVEPKQRQ